MEQFSRAAFRSTLKRAVGCLLEASDWGSGLTREVCQQLLLHSTPEAEDTEMEGVTEPGIEGAGGGSGILVGYPDSPLYERLSDCMACWLISGKCPVFDLPTPFLLSEEATDERKKKLETIGFSLAEVYSMWEQLSEEDRVTRILQALKLLGLRGVLDLLGIRYTAGSCEVLPPPRSTLLAAFNRPHSPHAKLSVGGRALSKHCHRDGTQQWWGTCTGSEQAKNEHALGVAEKILNSAVWINIHTLPHDTHVLEIRHREGYGMRWSKDGSEFRGFLEPQMEGGHSIGWKH